MEIMLYLQDAGQLEILRDVLNDHVEGYKFEASSYDFDDRFANNSAIAALTDESDKTLFLIAWRTEPLENANPDAAQLEVVVDECDPYADYE